MHHQLLAISMAWIFPACMLVHNVHGFYGGIPESFANTVEHLEENCGIQDEGGCCTGLGYHYCAMFDKCLQTAEWCPLPGECCLYEHTDFRGQSICFGSNEDFNSQAIDLRNNGFNDRASSIRCTGDAFVVVYADAGAMGDFRVFGGAIPDLRKSGPDSCIIAVSHDEIDPETGYTRVHYKADYSVLAGRATFSDPVLRPDGLNDRITSVQVLAGALGLAFARPLHLYENAEGEAIGGMFGANRGTIYPLANRCSKIPVEAPYDCGLSEILARHNNPGRKLKFALPPIGGALQILVNIQIYEAFVAGDCGMVPNRVRLGPSCDSGSNKLSRWCIRSIF